MLTDFRYSFNNELLLRRAKFVNYTIDNEGGGGDEISELLASAAGVYRDSELRERRDTNNTILLTSSNSGTVGARVSAKWGRRGIFITKFVIHQNWHCNIPNSGTRMSV